MGTVLFIIFSVVVVVAYVAAIVVPLGQMADRWKEEEDSMRAERMRIEERLRR